MHGMRMDTSLNKDEERAREENRAERYVLENQCILVTNWKEQRGRDGGQLPAL